MRVLLAALCAAFLSACAGESAARRCDLTASSEITFTSAGAADVVEVRTFGPDCSAAVAVFTVRSHEGLPVYAWASPMHPAFGDSFAPRTQDAASRGEVQDFLDRWSAPEVSTTRTAPPWSEDLTILQDAATYEDIRARDAPMLCFLSSVARQTCIYWESGVAAAGILFERDAIITP